MLTNANEFVSFPFEVTVTNSAPVISNSPLPMVDVYIGGTQTQKVTATDAEGHTITYAHAPALSYITFDNVDTYTIAPPVGMSKAKLTITLTLSDGNMKTTDTFVINVQTRPPVFTDGTKSFADVTVGSVTPGKSFVVPPFTDPDGETVKITLEDSAGGSVPGWAQLVDSDTKFQAVPASFSDLGVYNFKIVLTSMND